MRSVGSRIAAAAVWLVAALVVLHVSAGWGAQAPGDSVAAAAVNAAPASSASATTAPGGFGSAPALAQAQALGGFTPSMFMAGPPSIPAGKERLPDAGALTSTLTLDQAVYDIGEPIVATLTIRNASADRIAVGTGGDYRSGRPQRFRFHVTDAGGAAVADPLEVYANSGMGGGIWNPTVLGPGETLSVSTLLNIFATTRTPGRYTVAGDYEVLHKDNNHEALRIAWPPVTFEVRNQASHMSQKEGSDLLAKHDLAGTHPCILYGLQNDTSRIPELLAMAQTERRDPAPGQPQPTLAEQNAAPDAAEALVLMADKEALYGALGAEIAKMANKKAVYGALEAVIGKWYPEPDEEKSLFGFLAGLYQAAATPEALPLLEKSMGHSSRSFADLAFCTALSLGSAKALARLPAALVSKDEELRLEARFSAFTYLHRVNGPPDARMAGLATEAAPRYEDALLKHYCQDHPVPGDPTNPADWLLVFSSFHWASPRAWEVVLSAVRSDSEPKLRAVLDYLVNYSSGSYPAFWGPALDTRIADPENLASLVPFARRQMATSTDPMTRALAMRFLGLRGDAESVPALAAALDGADPQQRMAAAQALILLHHEPLLEKSIGRLVDDDGDMRPGQVIWLARQLGMKDYVSLQMVEGEKGVPRANMNPALPRTEPIPRTIEEMRDYRKAVLRRLAGVQSATTAPPRPAAASGETTN